MTLILQNYKKAAKGGRGDKLFFNKMLLPYSSWIPQKSPYLQEGLLVWVFLSLFTLNWFNFKLMAQFSIHTHIYNSEQIPQLIKGLSRMIRIHVFCHVLICPPYVHSSNLIHTTKLSTNTFISWFDSTLFWRFVRVLLFGYKLSVSHTACVTCFFGRGQLSQGFPLSQCTT